MKYETFRCDLCKKEQNYRYANIYGVDLKTFWKDNSGGYSKDEWKINKGYECCKECYEIVIECVTQLDK